LASAKYEQAADAVHAAAIRLLRAVRKEDAASGISGAQLSVLSVLVFAGPQTLGALAQAEQVKPPTMSQLVTGLEAQGLVQRRPLDRRSMEISATEKGRKLMEAGRKRRLARIARSLEKLPPAKLALLEEAARIMAEVAKG
jgi:DNA-binding MarR family transcriptional regulator